METDVLANLIRNKHTCLVQLREMGRRQIELVDEENISGVLDVLAAKQRLLIELQQIERALDPFRDVDPRQHCWRTPQDRDQCAEQLQQCESLLSEIVRQEHYSESVLTRRRDKAAGQLQGIQLAGQARKAYSDQPRQHSHRLDLQTDH